MKKMFLRTGAFAGLAFSALALASCGGSSEVEVKDAQGNTVKISQTEDSEAVTKALVVVAQNGMTKTEKNYAFSIDAKVDANINVSLQGITGNIAANASAYLGATLGNKTYKAYTPTEEGYAEADNTEAAAFLKQNLGVLASLDGSVKFSNVTVDEKYEGFANYSKEMLDAVKDSVSGYNNKTATAKARAFLYDGAFYVELDANAPKEMANAKEDLTLNYYGKAALPLDDMAAMISTALSDYQTLSYDELIEKYSSMLENFGVSLPAMPMGSFSIPENFFTSEDYTKTVNAIKELGVKISAVENNNVTFSVDLTINKVLNAAKSYLGEEAVTAIVSTLGLDDVNKDTTFLSLSISYDVVKNVVTQVKASSQALDTIATLVNAVAKVISMMQGSMSGTALIPEGALTGNFSFEANFKFDGDVSFTATPNNSYEYVDLDLGSLPFAA